MSTVKIVSDIIKNCQFQRSERDTIIIQQGEKGDCFYIILSGTVAIHINTTFGLEEDKKEEDEKGKKKTDEGEKKDKEKKDSKKLDRSLYGNFVGKIDVEDLEKVEARESLRRELSLPAKKEEPKSLSRQGSPVQHIYTDNKSGKKSPHGHRYVEVCLIGAVEIIGDIEATMGLPTYAQTVICTQEAEVYVLDQKNYDRLVEKRNPQTVEMMKEAVREKLKLRLSWVQEKELQLFRYFLYKLEEQEHLKQKRLNKREMETKDEPVDFTVCNLQKGPMIDMYGPGSVFYAIKMKEKQRELEKLRLHRQGFKTKTKDIAHKTNVIKSGLVGSSGISRMEDEENMQSHSNNVDDIDSAIRAQIVCDNGQGHFSDYEEEEMQEFVDEQSSDQALNQLEARIQAWHSSFENQEGRRSAKRTVKLHRFACEDKRKPIPGKKIVLRSKHSKDQSEHLEKQLQETEINSRTSPSNCPMCEANNSHDKSDTDPLTGMFIENQQTKVRRPLSSRINFVPPVILRKRRPKSARQYTAEEYEALKAELRQKQRAFKSMLCRPQTAF
ncbi:hypothetical protein KUTeg_022892 [Tegillarca granosa]|uniref:Cyclic nucleotide-binding domain-containing protein n=1 Tax=Tegillarca granosa TaxID=220873 RepID=A0ABQ9E4N8_TEGGR|nr:hypothetical protein KUTeg_022892 [Tegillarca granosa]